MFKRYRYWSMKAMRQEMHQPEAYIKSTMEKIGTLVRSGPFAMQWMLNAEYQESTYAGLEVKEEAAEEQEDSDVDPKDEVDDDDEDESLKMEDSHLSQDSRFQLAYGERQEFRRITVEMLLNNPSGRE
ncbi:hypothetical protein LTR16_009979 [Cryomyces antarcticus]|uniref:TFIIF beta subunit HTH domain-containing protein n=1 Tax=Cryomyces antarcticus TaxID=329879 RepID=A0ABR0LJB6_9PEZI|nr:hypothetical protein LTR16_009979 [Cryomyces antarcticus]